ncbi:MAG TPA: acetate--CoA ligase family protein [Spirochaetota bacterium]|nr:acetate--CoA ligase family protein [Spirochaetota bacterium]
MKDTMTNQLDRIFHAQSVAVIGASRDDKKRGFQAIRTLLDEEFEGDIYPINPNEDMVLGIKCFRSILDVEKPVDCALITTPAKTVLPLLDECGRKGVAGVVIIAGGFGELGDRGRKIEQEIVDTAKRYNMRIIGPNTSGMISVVNRMNLVGIRNVPKGNIALLSQSGNIALNLITEAQLRSRQGYSYYVGVGNEADLKFHEYLNYFANDKNTKAIVMYVEGLREGRKFLQEAYKTTRHKPIILLKSGRSSTGMKSAGSHTGALAGISEVSRTAFRRAGIITIESADELFPAAETLACLPPIRNKRVAILADGGGHATIASDLLTDLGIEIPALEDSTVRKLREILPPNASLRNPVDVAGGTDSNPRIFADCARILLEDKRVGGLLIVGLFGGYGIRFSESLTCMEEDAAHQMGKFIDKYNKPIVLHSLYNYAKPHSLELLRYYNITVYESLDVACKCIGVLSQYGAYLKKYQQRTSFILNWKSKANVKCQKIISGAIQEGRASLPEHEAREILRQHGAPVPEDYLARTGEEAVALARRIRGEVVMKIVSPDILHKSDAGGVRLRLKTDDDVREAFNGIMESAKKYNPKAVLEGCLVTPMVDRGVEIIIGTKIDDQFGPVIMFGLGGILVEVVKDVAFRVLPISRKAARAMMKEIKSAPILNGVRGEPPVDRNSIADLLLVVSEIVESYPEIQEMDLNPVIAFEHSIAVVDARIILKKKANGKNAHNGK